MRIVRFVCAVAIMAPVALLGQERPLFHAAANFVEVDAVVTDSHGQFVPGLTAADFEVREDRQAQPVSACTLVDFRNPATPAVDPSYRADLPANSQIAGGRIYLLYTAALPTSEMLLAHQQARVFVSEFMQPGDVATVWNAEALGSTVTFTTDKHLLLDEIDAPLAGSKPDPTQSLLTAVNWLSGVQGRRKSLILFTASASAPRLLQRLAPDSQGFSPRIQLGAGVRNDGRLGDLSRVTEQADVHIYAMDVGGLMTERPTISGNDVVARETAIGALRSIADRTGGLAQVNSNDYRNAFAKIVDDNSRYYVLGYDAPHKSGDGLYHALNVKALRPGLTVRARQGYIAR